jgi:quercetin dioxygenase-like cupin family protein
MSTATSAAAHGRPDERMPYQLPFPPDVQAEIVIPDAAAGDERLWVPQAPSVWIRPLLFNVSAGYWMVLLRVRRAGVLTRHRHPGPVHGFVLKGRWRYLEHHWVAEEGSYVYEPPGETHTLVVPDEVPEMITYFQVNGAMIYVDPQGRETGYEDVHSKIELARRHFAAIGLGADYVKQFIR